MKITFYNSDERKIKNLINLGLNVRLNVEKTVRKAFYKTGKLYVAQATRNINIPKTGVIARTIRSSSVKTRKEKVKIIRRSVPGDIAFANITGRGRQSLYFQATGKNLEYGFDSTAPYMKYVEFGTKKMKPRKTAFNAMVEVKPQINKLLFVEIDKMFTTIKK